MHFMELHLSLGEIYLSLIIRGRLFDEINSDQHVQLGLMMLLWKTSNFKKKNIFLIEILLEDF